MQLKAAIAKMRLDIRFGHGVQAATRRFQKSIRPEDYLNAMRTLGDDPAIRQAMFGITRAPDYRSLGLGVYDPKGFDAESSLLWMAASLRVLQSDINSFLSIERRLDLALNQGNWKRALETLDLADRTVGMSVWSLKYRICVIERLQGVKEQKAFVRALNARKDIKPVIRAMAVLTSSLAEEAQSADLFYDELEKLFQREFPREDIYQYLAFHTAFFGPFQFTKPLEILNFENGNSIVDRYLSFLRIAQMTAAATATSSVGKSFKKALTILGEGIEDSRITWLRLAYGISIKDRQWETLQKHLKAFDLYTLSKYEEAIRAIKVSVDSGARSLDFIELYARCLARLQASAERRAKESDEVYVGLKEMVGLLEADQASSMCMQRLKKDIACFCASDRSALLHSFLLQQTSPIAEGSPEKYQKFADLSGSLVNPRSVSRIVVNKGKLPKSLAQLLSESPAYELNEYSYYLDRRNRPSQLDSVPPTRLSKYSALRALRDSRPDIALNDFRILAESDDLLDKFDGLEGLCVCYAQIGDLSTASRILCNAVAEYPSLHRRLPIRRLCEQIEGSQLNLPQVNMPIEISNILGLYTSHLGKDKEYRMGTICEDFLRSWGCDSPGQLRIRQSEFDPRQLIFFLSVVCTVGAMDSHPSFALQIDVENARVDVLQWLVLLDPDNRNQYTEEIAGITRRQAISEAMHSVDMSRVTVNVEGVKSILPAEIEETYNRFRSLPNFGETEIQSLLKQLSKATLTSEALIVVIPRSERTEVLNRLYEAVKQRFIFNNDFGLDAYLSVGIRHSTLPGQLRACFERGHLVTQRQSDGTYVRNEFWEDKMELREMDLDARRSVQHALRGCSAAIDSLISLLRNELIQVKGEKHPEGFLSFDLTSSQLTELETRVNSASNIGGAIDAVIETLWAQTDAALTATRRLLRERFKRDVDAVLDMLERAVRPISFARFAELDSAITSTRTEFHDELEIIANWFTRGDAEVTEDYDLQLAIEIASQMVNRCYATRRLNLQPAIALGGRLVKARTLNAVVNVLFLVFDNALKHGKEKDGKVSLNLRIELRGTLLCIVATNETARTMEDTTDSKRLDEISAEVRAGSTTERVRGEGGSGLIKLGKILRIDLNAAPRLQFAFTRTGQEFELAIVVESDAILI
jgi:hypothetical protein